MGKILKAIFAVMGTVFIVFFCMGVIEAIFGNRMSLAAGLYGGVIAAAISAVITVFWVLPIHFLLVKFNRSQFHWYVYIAIIPIGFFMYLLALTGEYTPVTYLLQAAFSSAIGLSAAFVFWYVGVRKPSDAAKAQLS